MILVGRAGDGPPAVPSRIVYCAACQAPCYLSLETGARTIALARALGDATFTCTECVSPYAQILAILTGGLLR